MNLEQWKEFINREDVKNASVKPSDPDDRDFTLSAIVPRTEEIPTRASLNYTVPFILDQKQTPRCVGFAVANAVNSYYNYYGKMPENGFSPDWLYFRSFDYNNLDSKNEGTTIKSALKVAQKEGLLPWDKMPFDEGRKDIEVTEELKKEAAKYKIKGYVKLNSYDEICEAIAQGKMVVIGTVVTVDNWKDGYLIEPEGYFRGFHATFESAYDKEKTYKDYKSFLRGVNSWSEDYGHKGYYYLAKHYANFELEDMGINCLFEAWAIDMPELIDPKTPDDDEDNNHDDNEEQEDKEDNKEKIQKQFDVAPVIKNGRTMLELRNLANITDCENIAWDKEDKQVTLNYSDKYIKLWIGQKEYEVNGKKKEFDVEPKIINGRTMLEVRDIVEVTEANKIDWNNEEKEVILYYNDKIIRMWIGKKKYIVEK